MKDEACSTVTGIKISRIGIQYVILMQPIQKKMKEVTQLHDPRRKRTGY
jgi:hypothetical protein